MEDESAVCLFGQQRGTVGSQQVVHAITPADVLTNIFLKLDQVLDGGAFCEHVEHRGTVIGNRIAVISSILLIEIVMDLTKDTGGQNTRRSGGSGDSGEARTSIEGNGSAVINSRFHTQLGRMGKVIVIVAFDPLDVDVVGQDLDVVVYIVNREGRGANIFQADVVGLDGLLAELEGLRVEGIAHGFDRSQAGIVLTGLASDADVFPSRASGNGALGDDVGDRFAHVVGECRLGNKTEIRIFVETQTIGAEGYAP